MTFDERLVYNNSIVNRYDIYTPDRVSLQCWTDDNTTTSWYYPDGTEVPINSPTAFFQTSGDRVSILSRHGGGVDGVYSCVVPGQDGDEHTLYIGIYGSPGKKSCVCNVCNYSVEYLYHECPQQQTLHHLYALLII